MRNNVAVALIILCCFIIGVIEVKADENDVSSTPDKELWFIGPRIGYSTFTGIIGLEIQYRHMALTVGAPGNIGVKYYFSVPENSWFIGGAFQEYDSDDDEVKDGITFDESTRREGGIAGGYRWR